MIKLTKIYKNNLPLGYFKRIVRPYPVFNTQMGVDMEKNGLNKKIIGRNIWKVDDRGNSIVENNNKKNKDKYENNKENKTQNKQINNNINKMGRRKSSIGVNKTNADKFTIFRVNSRLVDSKNLNKYLKKVNKRYFNKDEIECLLKYIVINMPQTLDDVNIFTIMIMMSKLEIRDEMLFNSIIPYMYKMKDFDKIIDCILYGSMLFGDNDSLKVFATKLICDFPDHINSINYNNISKLCEDFGRVISKLVGKDTLIGNEIPILNFSSILNYLSRVEIGDENVWKTYTKYSLDNLSISNHKIIMRLLQSYCNKNICNKELLKNAGDRMIKYIEIMHPNDVANLSYLYFKMNYKHDLLFEEIFKVGERISTNLDGSASLRLLSGYYLNFSHIVKLEETPMFINNLEWDRYLHCFRSVYLVYNNISNNLNSLNFEDFLLLFKTLELFSFINTTNLQMNLKVFLRDYNKSKDISSRNIDIIKMRFSEKKMINPGEQRFIRLLMS